MPRDFKTRMVDILKTKGVTAVMTRLSAEEENIAGGDQGIPSLIDTWVSLGAARKVPMNENTAVPDNVDAPSEAPDSAYVLRLYVTGQTPRSVLAIENMRKICAEHLSDRYTLEVIDIYLHPEECQQQQIIAAPTLIKVLPHPLRRIIGDLSNTEKVLVGLDLRARPIPTEKAGD